MDFESHVDHLHAFLSLSPAYPRLIICKLLWFCSEKTAFPVILLKAKFKVTAFPITKVTDWVPVLSSLAACYPLPQVSPSCSLLVRRSLAASALVSEIAGHQHSLGSATDCDKPCVGVLGHSSS